MDYKFLLMSEEERKQLMAVLTRENVAMVERFSHSIKKTHILGGLGAVAIALFLIVSAILDFFWSALFVPVFGGVFGIVIYFVSLHASSKARAELLKRISGGKLTYPMYKALRNTADKQADDTATPAPQHNENAIFEIKRIARIRGVLGICKWAPILLALILLALPLVNVDLLLTEFDVCIYDFVLATEENEELEDEIVASIAAGFLGVDEEVYTNFYMGLFTGGWSEAPEDATGFAYVLHYLLNALTFMAKLGSVVALVFMGIAAVVSIICAIQKSMVEGALRRMSGYELMQIYQGIRVDLCREAGAHRVLKMLVRLLVPMALAWGFFFYMPWKLISYLNSDPLITVHSALFPAFVILLLLHIAFTIVEFLYSFKRGAVLNPCDRVLSLKHFL